MASEEEREDLSDQEESVSETESSEGSDAGMADAEPVVVAAQHNYNLRPKRGLPDSVTGAAQTNKSEVAPGVGVEANKVPVGGRDHGDPAKRKDGNLRSPAPAVEKNRINLGAVVADSRLMSDQRDRVVDRAGGVSWHIPDSDAVTAQANKTKESEIAPGVGVVANRYLVGGRDQRISCRPDGVTDGSESSDVERSDADRGRKRRESDESGCSSSVETLSESYDGRPRHRDERQGTTLERRRLASSLTTRMSREEIEVQSARLRAHLRKGMKERLRTLPPPTNELVIRQDSSRPSDAGRKAKNRREPSASDLLGQVPVKPGRDLFSDIFKIE